MSGISEFLTQTDLKTSLSNGGFSGITSRVQVNSNSRGKFAILYPTANGYEMADASSDATSPGTVMALEAGTGSSVLVLRRGYVRNTSWSFTRGALLYLDTYAGKVRQTAPAGPNDIVQYIGTAYDTDIMDFGPDTTTATIADTASATTTTTTVAPATTTTTTAIPQWYIVENNDFWTSSDTTWHSNSGGYWEGTVYDAELTDIGTWVRGYRPTKIRVTIVVYGFPESGSVYLYDAENNVLASATNQLLSNGVPKVLEMNLTFQGTTAEYDIDRLSHVISASGPFRITNIEFYGQYVPGSRVTTTTTTTAAATTTTTTTAAATTTSTTTAAGGTTTTTTTAATTTTTTTL